MIQKFKQFISEGFLNRDYSKIKPYKWIGTKKILNKLVKFLNKKGYTEKYKLPCLYGDDCEDNYKYFEIEKALTKSIYINLWDPNNVDVSDFIIRISDHTPTAWRVDSNIDILIDPYGLTPEEAIQELSKRL
ncbi:MAG: hypothetical protein ACOC2U_03370 [bacterium]